MFVYLFTCLENGKINAENKSIIFIKKYMYLDGDIILMLKRFYWNFQFQFIVKLRFLKCLLIFGKRKKSHEFKLREYGSYGIIEVYVFSQI